MYSTGIGGTDAGKNAYMLSGKDLDILRPYTVAVTFNNKPRY